jgi:hypothetical protein
MERPAQHVTDALGQTQLSRVLEPLGWTLTPILADYGVDFDVEVFKENKTTGVTFKLQLKSSRSTTYSADGRFVAEILDVKNVRYLLQELHTPTILAHADLGKELTFWCAPQLDTDAAQRIGDRNEGTITFRIPTANVLPESIDALLQAVTRATILLATRALTSAPPVDLVAALRAQPDLDLTIRELRDKTDVLRLEQAFKLMLAGKLDEAQVNLARIYEDGEATVDTRFAAVLQLEQVETRQAICDRKPDKFRIQRKLVAAERLRSLTRHGPTHLKLYAVATRKLAQLDSLIHESWGVFLNVHITIKRGGDALWAAQLVFRWASVTRSINHKLRECFGFLNYALGTPEGWALGDPVLRLGKSLFLLASQLRIQGGSEAAKHLDDNAFQLFRLAAEMARRVGDEQRLADAAVPAFLLSPNEDSDKYRWMEEQLSQIRDPGIRRAADEYLDRLRRRKKGEKFADTDIETTEKQIYENIALGAGIDLDDPDDPVAELVRIGIQDLDPNDALRVCEHTFITLQPNPLLRATLRLPTAGLKVLHCTKHGHSVRAIALDLASKALQERFCSQCPDRAPRPTAWSYTEEWQQRENEKHAQFAATFWGNHPKYDD